ncbi:MAG: TlpA family protein disulfide reductase [Cyclobacteriaceae bacterium]
MNRNFIAILASAFAFIACSKGQQEALPINGKVLGGSVNQQLNLLKLVEDGFETVDSLSLADDGVFAFNIVSPTADFYRFELSGSQVMNLIITGEEEAIEVIFDNSNPQKSLVDGSISANFMQSLDSTARKMNSDVQLLNQEALQARSSGNSLELQDITEQYYYLMGRHNENMKQIIRDAYPTLTSLYGLEYLEFEQEFAFADSIVSLFRSDYASHPLASTYIERVDAMRALAIGSEAPEINLPDPDGKLLALSSLRGKYVLIDFWAAWCRPCRMENPNVVRMYEKYKNEKFEILGVSLDRTKDAWLNAIEDDGLTWKHVSDLQYFNSEAARSYQINAIPATYLIDPKGKIIDKNLRGPSLEAKLKEIFG